MVPRNSGTRASDGDERRQCKKVTQGVIDVQTPQRQPIHRLGAVLLCFTLQSELLVAMNSR